MGRGPAGPDPCRYSIRGEYPYLPLAVSARRAAPAAAGYCRLHRRPDSAWLPPLTTMPQVTAPPAGMAPS